MVSFVIVLEVYCMVGDTCVLTCLVEGCS